MCKGKRFLLALITVGLSLLLFLTNSYLDHVVRGTFRNAGFGNRKHISDLKWPESNTLVHDEQVPPSSTGGEHGNSISIGLDGIKNVQSKQSTIKKMHFKQIDHPRTKITKESIRRIKAIQKVIKTHANPEKNRHSKYKADSDGSDTLIRVNDSMSMSSIMANPENTRQKQKIIAAKYGKLLRRPSCLELFQGKKEHSGKCQTLSDSFSKESKIGRRLHTDD